MSKSKDSAVSNEQGAGLDPEARAAERSETPAWHRIIRFLWPYAQVLLPIVLTLTFVFTLVAVDGTSMMPTLRTGERVLLLKYEAWLHRWGVGQFKRGDILVFDPPQEVASQVRILGLWNSTPSLIKRLIGLPGDRVRIQKGVVYINNRPLEQGFTIDFWKKQGCWQTTARPLERDVVNNVDPNYTDGRERTVPPGEYFLMGDNRSPGGSLDSRSFGMVAQHNILGRATGVLWPFVRRAQATDTCQGNDKTSVKLSGALQGNWRVLSRPQAFKVFESLR